jgi:signal transduction histidine kinase/DNA-binding response OmpR family regulator
MEAAVQVLVVDDSQPIREFVAQALASQEGFVTLEASDGTEGLEMVLADSPDLILCDLEMPGLNGIQILDALHAQQAGIPVILMTSHDSEPGAVEFLRKGVRGCLIKPFTAREMHDVVERALAEVRLRQEKEALARQLAAANEQLARRAQELDTLYHAGKSVTSLLSRDQLLEQILDAVFYVIDAEEAALTLVDEKSGQLQTEFHRQRVPGEAHQAVHRSAKEPSPAAVHTEDATPAGAMLSVPLKLCGRLIGALSVGNRVSTYSFSGHDRQLLLALANYAVIAIKTTRLHEGVPQADRVELGLVSFVARELRTSVISVRGCADLLARGTAGPLTPQQEKLICAILDSAERMQGLVSDLRDTACIKMDQLHAQMKPVRLAEPLEDGPQATCGQSEARPQQLAVDMPEDLPRAHADPARLAQVLTDLLSDVYKHTPEGGHIHVRAWLQNGHVHFAVSDIAAGVSPEDQARLPRVSCSDDLATRESPGTELGLCLAKGLVELQDGEIEVESQPGKGMIFTFTMPVAAESQSEGEQTFTFTTPAGLETWHGRKFVFTTPIDLDTLHGRKKAFAFTTPVDLETWHGRKKTFPFTTPADLETWHGRKKAFPFTTPADSEG